MRVFNFIISFAKISQMYFLELKAIKILLKC